MIFYCPFCNNELLKTAASWFDCQNHESSLRFKVYFNVHGRFNWAYINYHSQLNEYEIYLMEDEIIMYLNRYHDGTNSNIRSQRIALDIPISYWDVSNIQDFKQQIQNLLVFS